MPLLRRSFVALLLAAAAPLASAQPGGFREITWDDLVPKDWDPMKQFREMNFGVLNDADPRAQEMLKKLRAVWDNAPTNNAMDNQRIRVPGYVVPLEETKAGLKEFLLVPYFGACIHSPPPPSNQIVHITSAKPVPLKSMDVIWASGTLRTLRTDSFMGASSYRLEATAIEPYQAPVETPKK